MQSDQIKITAIKKAERIRNGRTPDRTDVRSLNLSTMSTMSPKRKIHTSRMSMMPTTSHTNNSSRFSAMPPPSLNSTGLSKVLDSTTSTELKKMQLDNQNLEMELMYSQYISTHAELILEKKKTNEGEESFRKTIFSLCEESKVLLETCVALQTKIKDIQAYSALEDYQEILTQNMDELINKLKNDGIMEKLSFLEKALSRFNILQCENILLPSTAEEVTEFKKVLKDCSAALQQISNPKQADDLENLSKNYVELVKIFTDFISIKKTVEETIGNLQMDTLQTCSHLLSQFNEAC